MYKILLVNNVSLNQEKFVTQNALLFQSAQELDCQLDIMTNTSVYDCIINGQQLNYDAVMFYDKDIHLAKTLENMGLKVFNSSDAIANCDSKASTEICLARDNIARPKTCIIPLTFFYHKEYYSNYIDNIIQYLKLPLICKEWYGSWGEQVYKLNSKEEIEAIIDKKQGKELLFQEYIKECKGQDIRINIVGNKVVASMKRTSINDDFRANISNGGTMSNYTPTQEEIDLALKAAKSVGCDFCGVDILQSQKGPLVCEVNSNAHLLNIYACTKENVGKDILGYILEKIK